MKNVIYIVVDSLSQKVLDDFPCKDELFLTKLKSTSLVCTNMYCQGPYTEANTNGIFSGQKALDNSACLFLNDKCPDSLNDLFARNNYSVYYSNWPAHHSLNYHDDNVFYDLSVLDMYRLNDLRNQLIKHGKLTDEELCVARATIKKWMVDAIYLYNDFLNSEARTNLHSGLLDNKKLNETIKHYQNILASVDDDDFLFCVVKNGIKSILLPTPLASQYKDSSRYNDLFSYYFSLFLKEQNKHLVKGGKAQSFLFNAKAKSQNYFNILLRLFKWMLYYEFKNVPKDRIRKIANGSLNVSILHKKPFFSMRRRIDDVICFLDNVHDNKPFYVCIQPQDFHQPSTFFTYDVDCYDLVKSELQDQLTFAKRIPTTLKCNIFSHMSLRYIDNQIKRLFEYLNNTGKLDNTVFIVTSDHGYWNYFDKYPILDPIDVMDEVRMHVPFIAYSGEGSRKTVVDKVVSNNSVPRTICELTGLKSNESFEPSIFGSINKYVISEYFNGGSPDILNKPIHYIVRDNRFKLLIIASINEDVGINNCVMLFDLFVDKNERRNILSKKQYYNMVKEMVDVVSKRHNDLKKKLNDYYIPPDSWTKCDYKHY